MEKYRRIFTIVLNSPGDRAMDNAADYGDVGTDTLGHIDEEGWSFSYTESGENGNCESAPVNPCTAGRKASCLLYRAE